MASSIARVSSAALIELKTDLTRLSRTLHQIYELMNADMRQVNAAWQDGKYEEFVQGYQPQIRKCEEIANRYNDWCMRVLDPSIEHVIDVERTDVGGSSSLGGDSASAVAGGTMATSTTAGIVGKASSFNMNGNKPIASRSPEADAIVNSLSSGGLKKPEADRDRKSVV